MYSDEKKLSIWNAKNFLFNLMNNYLVLFFQGIQLLARVYQYSFQAFSLLCSFSLLCVQSPPKLVPHWLLANSTLSRSVGSVNSSSSPGSCAAVQWLLLAVKTAAIKAVPLLTNTTTSWLNQEKYSNALQEINFLGICFHFELVLQHAVALD